METLAVVGLVSAILQFVEIGYRTARRVREFQDDVGKVPELLRDIHVQLPLLCLSLKRAQEQAESGVLDVESQEALLQVVEACRQQTEKLDRIIDKLLPDLKDSSWERGRKAISSLKYEREIQQIKDDLHGHINILTYHQTLNSTANKLGQLNIARPQGPLFRVPFSRDPNFVGRAEVLDKIRASFQDPGRVALVGIGGVGKSQIAIEFSYRFASEHHQQNVFWAHCSNTVRFEQAFQDIARQLGLPGWETQSTNTLKAVKEWLEDPAHKWLLILDNVDDIELFYPATSGSVSEPKKLSMLPYLPRSDTGRMLLTTRDRRVGERLANRASIVTLREPVEEEAILLMKQRLGKEDDDEKLLSLARELACHPLAISQAISFINETAITISDYLEMLMGEDDLDVLLDEDHGDERRDVEDADQTNSILRTFKVSYDRVIQSVPRSQDIMSLAAVLDRQSIPRYLLLVDKERKIDWVKGFGALQALSFIDCQDASGPISMHRLVQLCARQWLRMQSQLLQWQEQALLRLHKNFNLSMATNDNRRIDDLLPHALMVLGYNLSSSAVLEEKAELLYRVGCLEYKRRNLNTAFSLLNEAVEYYRSSGATMSDDVGKLRKATAAEQALCDTMSNMSFKGTWETAEDIQKSILDRRRQAFGADDPDTLASQIGLVIRLSERRRWEAAETVILQIREVYSRLYDENDPVYLRTDLMLLYVRVEMSHKTFGTILDEEMEPRAQDLAPDDERRWKYVVASMLVLEEREDVKGSNLLCTELYAIVKAKLGERSAEAVSLMTYLATQYQILGDLDRAAELQLAAIKIREDSLVEDRVDNINALLMLGDIRMHQNRFEEALDFVKSSWRQCEESFGRSHYMTLDAKARVAYTLMHNNDCTDAIRILEEVRTSLTEVLPRDHKELMSIPLLLSYAFEHLGQYDMCVEHSEYICNALNQFESTKHVDQRAFRNRLERYLLLVGNYERARDFGEETLRYCLGAGTADNLETVKATFFLVRAYTALGHEHDDRAQVLLEDMYRAFQADDVDVEHDKDTDDAESGNNGVIDQPHHDDGDDNQGNNDSNEDAGPAIGGHENESHGGNDNDRVADEQKGDDQSEEAQTEGEKAERGIIDYTVWLSLHLLASAARIQRWRRFPDARKFTLDVYTWTKRLYGEDADETLKARADLDALDESTAGEKSIAGSEGLDGEDPGFEDVVKCYKWSRLFESSMNGRETLWSTFVFS